MKRKVGNGKALSPYLVLPVALTSYMYGLAALKSSDTNVMIRLKGLEGTFVSIPGLKQSV